MKKHLLWLLPLALALQAGIVFMYVREGKLQMSKTLIATAAVFLFVEVLQSIYMRAHLRGEFEWRNLRTFTLIACLIVGGLWAVCSGPIAFVLIGLGFERLPESIAYLAPWTLGWLIVTFALYAKALFTKNLRSLASRVHEL